MKPKAKDSIITKASDISDLVNRKETLTIAEFCKENIIATIEISINNIVVIYVFIFIIYHIKDKNTTLMRNE